MAGHLPKVSVRFRWFVRSARACLAVLLLSAGGVPLAVALPVATASGETEAEAREAARAELAKFVHVEVRSEVGQAASSTGEKEAWVKNVSRTQLVLLGVSYECRQAARKLFECDARFDEAAARKLYATSVEEAARRITEGARALDSAPVTEATRRIDTLLTELDRVESLLLVYRFLLDAQSPVLPVTREDLLGRLAKLEDALPDLRTAANHLTAQLDASMTYYVAPPKPVGSEEVTPFARALTDAVAAGIQVSLTPAGAKRWLTGQYQVTDTHILVTWRVVMPDGRVEQTLVERMARTGAGNLRATAMDRPLDELLQSGLVVSGNLRAEIATNAGSVDGQVFKAGDRIRLLAKLNKPGYFYLLGHVSQQDKEYSYLVELNDPDPGAQPGSPEAKRVYVRYVSAAEANRYVELGEFEVSPPFGVERLQLFASTTDVLGQLPPFAIRAQDENRIEGPAQAVIGKTRALMRVKPKAETVEATFTYTTLPTFGEAGAGNP